MSSSVPGGRSRPLSSLRVGYRRWRHGAQGILLITPLLAVLIGLLAYPVLSAFILSFQAKISGSTAKFIGLANYVQAITKDRAIGEILINTVFYATASVLLKTVIGLVMALILNESIPGRNFFRGWLLLPWIAPVLVTALTWRWMFDQTGGVINYVLSALGIFHMPPAWLAEKWLARFSLVVANVWRGFPFFGVTLLAGLQSIPAEMYEAAEMDGAGVWQRITHITLPWLEPVLLVVIILSTIWTFNDFTLVWVLTQGGPSFNTHLFATYAFWVAFRQDDLGYASAVSFVATPLLILFIALLAPRMWREDET